jgi:hypothetical protein
MAGGGELSLFEVLKGLFSESESLKRLIGEKGLVGEAGLLETLSKMKPQELTKILESENSFRNFLNDQSAVKSLSESAREILKTPAVVEALRNLADRAQRIPTLLGEYEQYFKNAGDGAKDFQAWAGDLKNAKDTELAKALAKTPEFMSFQNALQENAKLKAQLADRLKPKTPVAPEDKPAGGTAPVTENKIPDKQPSVDNVAAGGTETPPKRTIGRLEARNVRVSDKPLGDKIIELASNPGGQASLDKLRAEAKIPGSQPYKDLEKNWSTIQQRLSAAAKENKNVEAALRDFEEIHSMQMRSGPIRTTVAGLTQRFNYFKQYPVSTTLSRTWQTATKPFKWALEPLGIFKSGEGKLAKAGRVVKGAAGVAALNYADDHLLGGKAKETVASGISTAFHSGRTAVADKLQQKADEEKKEGNTVTSWLYNQFASVARPGDVAGPDGKKKGPGLLDGLEDWLSGDHPYLIPAIIGGIAVMGIMHSDNGGFFSGLFSLIAFAAACFIGYKIYENNFAQPSPEKQPGQQPRLQSYTPSPAQP